MKTIVAFIGGVVVGGLGIVGIALNTGSPTSKSQPPVEQVTHLAPKTEHIDTPPSKEGPVPPEGRDLSPEDIDWSKRGRECSLSLNYKTLLPPWVCEGGVSFQGKFFPNEESKTEILRDLETAFKTIDEKFGCTPPAQDMTRSMRIRRYTIGCGGVIYHVRKDKTTGQFKAAKTNPNLTSDQLDWR